MAADGDAAANQLVKNALHQFGITRDEPQERIEEPAAFLSPAIEVAGQWAVLTVVGGVVGNAAYDRRQRS
jgi:hypothetical protein